MLKLTVLRILLLPFFNLYVFSGNGDTSHAEQLLNEQSRDFSCAFFTKVQSFAAEMRQEKDPYHLLFRDTRQDCGYYSPGSLWAIWMIKPVGKFYKVCCVCDDGVIISCEFDFLMRKCRKCNIEAITTARNFFESGWRSFTNFAQKNNISPSDALHTATLVFEEVVSLVQDVQQNSGAVRSSKEPSVLKVFPKDHLLSPQEGQGDTHGLKARWIRDGKIFSTGTSLSVVSWCTLGLVRARCDECDKKSIDAYLQLHQLL